MWRYCEGFREGAKYVDATVNATVVYRENGSREKLFIDAEWGAENAQKLVQGGADVLFAVGGETGAGALRAANEAGIRTIGAERDQGAALGDQGSGVVTSILGSGSITVQMLMRSLRGGSFNGALTGPIEYVPFDEVVTKSVVLKMDEIKGSLTSGRIELNIPRQKP